MAGKWGDGSDSKGGGVADEQEMTGTRPTPTPKPDPRKTALGFYSALANTSLAGFDVMGLGMTPGSLDQGGNVLGNPNLIYENGQLMVKTDMINSFYSVFKGQQESARARAASFLAQDTLLGESASKKGTVLGGVI